MRPCRVHVASHFAQLVLGLLLGNQLCKEAFVVEVVVVDVIVVVVDTHVLSGQLDELDHWHGVELSARLAVRQLEVDVGVVLALVARHLLDVRGELARVREVVNVYEAVRWHEACVVGPGVARGHDRNGAAGHRLHELLGHVVDAVRVLDDHHELVGGVQGHVAPRLSTNGVRHVVVVVVVVRYSRSSVELFVVEATAVRVDGERAHELADEALAAVVRGAVGRAPDDVRAAAACLELERHKGWSEQSDEVLTHVEVGGRLRERLVQVVPHAEVGLVPCGAAARVHLGLERVHHRVALLLFVFSFTVTVLSERRQHFGRRHVHVVDGQAAGVERLRRVAHHNVDVARRAADGATRLRRAEVGRVVHEKRATVTMLFVSIFLSK